MRVFNSAPSPDPGERHLLAVALALGALLAGGCSEPPIDRFDEDRGDLATDAGGSTTGADSQAPVDRADAERPPPESDGAPDDGSPGGSSPTDGALTDGALTDSALGGGGPAVDGATGGAIPVSDRDAGAGGTDNDRSALIVSLSWRGYRTRALGSTASADVTVRNNHPAPLEIQTIAIEGAHARDFSVESPSSGRQPDCNAAELARRARCYFQIAFTPSAAGPREARLVIRASDPDVPQTEVTLSGVGYPGPLPRLTLDSREAGSGAVVSHLLDSFGAIRGGASRPVTITLNSVGEGTVQVGPSRISGDDAADFAIAQDDCEGVALAPKQSCTVILELRPASVGRKEATLEIPSNDPNRPVLKQQLKGYARPPAQGCRVEISSGGCPAHPGTSFPLMDDHEGSATNSHRCLDRAAELGQWCNIGPHVAVEATAIGADLVDSTAPEAQWQRRDLHRAWVRQGCRIQTASCPAHPESANTALMDNDENAGLDRSRCAQRATDYVRWCKMVPSNEEVVASYYADGRLKGLTQAIAACIDDSCNGFAADEEPQSACFRRAAERESSVIRGPEGPEGVLLELKVSALCAGYVAAALALPPRTGAGSLWIELDGGKTAPGTERGGAAGGRISSGIYQRGTTKVRACVAWATQQGPATIEGCTRWL